MRQEDREIKEFDEIIEVMKKCDVCRLALNDDGLSWWISASGKSRNQKK